MDTKVLKSHTGDVSSVSYHSSSSLLASGSEDGTCRLWDLRTERPARCLVLSKEINTVKFHPQREHSIFMASGTTVSEFDLRRPEIVLRDSSSFKHQCRDDINQLALDGELLVVCDDVGDLTVLDASNHEKDPITVCTGAHENVCSSVQSLGSEKFISGGMDCQLAVWKFDQRTQRLSPECKKNTNELLNQAVRGDRGQAWINPPFVHTVDARGALCAIGLGDGTVLVTDSSLRPTSALQSHLHFVSSVSFASDNVLCSGGNDGQIFVWNVPPTPTPSSSSSKKGKKSAAAAAAVNISSSPRATIRHPGKVECLVAINPSEGGSLRIAAPFENSVLLYTVPS